MKNKDIYSIALSILAQNIDGEENSDFEERAPYILANFCRDLCELDKIARKLTNTPANTNFTAVRLSLESDFPLLDRFASAAAKYLAAMLVIDEDSELSDRLYDMYCETIASIQSQLPSLLEKITDKYL